ncbi:putative Isoflavone reductase like protein IRL [Glarea lozoyensis 74030]|uniref:Putative Isoflavone reductase like protein IRL n=1 Tax=Glarea lozoyensis (strain ATCC 74030 / MF5533) TaxID=1104152 RepID=H0ERD9_GLAL7|nr:putative Isoflavone reductase like protein IRL [Glarea lozoyensis 74030]
MPAPSILLLGASGYLGVPLLAEFLTHRSKFSRLAILTDESRKHKFEDAKAKGVELIIGSYLEPDSFKGFNTVLSLLGNHAMADQPSIIKACLAAKVTEFYPSEFGGDSSQGPVCRYTVASTLMPKSPSGARSFKIPEAWYTWNFVEQIVLASARWASTSSRIAFMDSW